MEAMDPDPKPIIRNYPIDPELQTGESKLLGGGMSIHAPWSENGKNDNRPNVDQ